MKKREIVILAFLAGILSSCIGTKDIKYLQPNENLQINSEGLVPYNVPTYRVTKNDILSLNIITTPKGDAAQFYSSYNTSGSSVPGGTIAMSASGVGGCEYLWDRICESGRAYFRRHYPRNTAESK